MSMLLENTSNPGFFEKYWLLIILVVMIIAMFVFNFLRQKKYQQQEAKMLEDIKVGTKVKTYAGVYGTIVGMYDSTDGKVAILSLDGKATMEVDFRSIYVIDNKTEVTAEKTEENAEEVKAEPVAEANKEPKQEDSKPAEEPKAKKAKKEEKNQD